MDVTDDFPLLHEVVIKRVPTSFVTYTIPMLNTSELRTKVIDVHSNAVLVISFKYVAFVNLLAGAVAQSGELADGGGVNPRLGFAVSDGACAIIVGYQASIDPMPISCCLASEFNRSHAV